MGDLTAGRSRRELAAIQRAMDVRADSGDDGLDRRRGRRRQDPVGPGSGRGGGGPRGGHPVGGCHPASTCDPFGAPRSPGRSRGAGDSDPAGPGRRADAAPALDGHCRNTCCCGSSCPGSQHLTDRHTLGDEPEYRAQSRVEHLHQLQVTDRAQAIVRTRDAWMGKDRRPCPDTQRRSHGIGTQLGPCSLVPRTRLRPRSPQVRVPDRQPGR